MGNSYQRNQKNADAMVHFRMPQNDKVSPARLLALEVTQEVRLKDAFAHNILEARLKDHRAAGDRISPEDRAFATTLVLGVIQTRCTLDEVIDRALDNPHDIKPNVRDALRISTYEIIYLDKISHAAVDQGVELVRSVVPRAAGLANAVLRRIVKLAEDFPFGDPAHDKAAFARLQAFPNWLAARLESDLGERAARAHMEASNDPAPLFVAVNAVQCCHDEEITELFEAVGTTVEPVELMGQTIPGCYRIGDSKSLTDGRIGYQIDKGRMLVSDASSQSVANMVVEGAFACWTKRGKQSPVPQVLEIGAGRATKTILLQSDAVRLAGTQMELTTVDNQQFKVDLLKNRVKTYGVQVKEALFGDATDLGSVVGSTCYDCVFLDSPCTGLGTLRRHPEIRWRIRSRNIVEAAELSYALLQSAAEHVALGGMLVYATCTVTKDENVLLVKRFLETDLGKNYRVLPIDGHVAFATALSHGSPDAHFAMRLVRVS